MKGLMLMMMMMTIRYDTIRYDVLTFVYGSFCLKHTAVAAAEGKDTARRTKQYVHGCSIPARKGKRY